MDRLIKKLKVGATRQKAHLSSSLMVVEDVGYLPVNTEKAYLFFQFVSQRYERSLTIITSNKSFGDWEFFDNCHCHGDSGPVAAPQ